MPEDVQCPPVAQPLTEPPRAAVALPQQIVWLLPALAVAGVLMVRATCAVASGHGAHGPLEVSVSVTPPAAMSASDGQYEAVTVFAPGLNVPVPVVVQVPPVAQPPTEPPKATQLVPQIVWSPPALAVGGVLFGIIALVKSNRGSAGTGPAPIAAVESPAAKPGAKTNPLQKYIEISGVRFVMDAKKKTVAVAQGNG